MGPPAPTTAAPGPSQWNAPQSRAESEGGSLFDPTNSVSEDSGFSSTPQRRQQLESFKVPVPTLEDAGVHDWEKMEGGEGEVIDMDKKPDIFVGQEDEADDQHYYDDHEEEEIFDHEEREFSEDYDEQYDLKVEGFEDGMGQDAEGQRGQWDETATFSNRGWSDGVMRGEASEIPLPASPKPKHTDGQKKAVAKDVKKRDQFHQVMNSESPFLVYHSL
jgi:hypothetical protein